MDKEQALQSFFSQFDVPAYDEYTVPEDAVLPYITYETITDNFGAQNVLTASIWDRNTSWASVIGILHKIENKLGYGGQTINYDGGLLWVKRGMPFAQRMNDTDDSIRRIVLNLEIEYLSEV